MIDANLFFSEILFTIIVAVATLVFWQLKMSKNGMLRKILMAYFLVEIYMFSLMAVFWWYADRGNPIMSIQAFRLWVLIPKTAIKVVLLGWLMRQNRRRKLNSSTKK